MRTLIPIAPLLVIQNYVSYPTAFARKMALMFLEVCVPNGKNVLGFRRW